MRRNQENEKRAGRGGGSPPVNGYAVQLTRIYVDVEDDWEEVSARHDDDGGGLDIERLWMAHAEQHLFLRLELGPSIHLQEDNELTLYLDTDNDPTTGRQTLGIGAELSWTFGQRTGQVFRNGSPTDVGHAAIGLTSLPTVRADAFEIALDRSATPGGGALFQSDSLRIALSNDGNRLPDTDGGLGYIPQVRKSYSDRFQVLESSATVMDAMEREREIQDSTNTHRQMQAVELVVTCAVTRFSSTIEVRSFSGGFSDSVGDTMLGLNLLGGVSFPLESRMKPFAQARLTLGQGATLDFDELGSVETVGRFSDRDYWIAFQSLIEADCAADGFP